MRAFCFLGFGFWVASLGCVCLRRWFGFASQSLRWRATTARDGPAGMPLPSRRTWVGSEGCAFFTRRHYRRSVRGMPTVPSAMSWRVRVKGCHAIAKAIEWHSHGMLVGRDPRLCSAPACPAGRDIRGGHSRFRRSTSRPHAPAASHEFPTQQAASRRRSTVNAAAFTVDRRTQVAREDGSSCEAAGAC